jgi:hypothetical protein
MNYQKLNNDQVLMEYKTNISSSGEFLKGTGRRIFIQEFLNKFRITVSKEIK